MRVLRFIAGLLAVLVALVIAADALRVVIELAADEGCPGAAGDPLCWQKVGELLVILPWCGVLLRRKQQGSSALLAPFLLTGAVLQVASWFPLRERANWAPWCLALAATAPLLLLARSRRWTQGLATVLLVLGWGAASVWGVFGSGYRWYPIPGPVPEPAPTRDGRWRQDLAVLESELVRLHVDAFHTISPEELRAGIARLDAEIPELSDLEIGVRLAAIVAGIGDAHTGLDGGYFRHVRKLPIGLEWMSDGLVLTHVPADLPEAAALLGSLVTHLSGVAVEELLERVAAVIPHENRSWLLESSPRYLIRPQILRALGAIPDADSGSVELTLAKGGETTVKAFEPVEPGTTLSLGTAHVDGGLADRHPDEHFWLERLPEHDAIYVRYRRCRDFAGFRAFAGELLDEVERDPPGRLVLDLRGNSGGSSLQYSAFLLPGLRKSELNDPERLYVLIDRGTYSSGSGNAIETARKTRATLVGEPTGGALNVYGEVRWFRLPGSGLYVTYSTKLHRRWPGSEADTLEPDVEIVPSSKDWLANRDPVLERALR